MAYYNGHGETVMPTVSVTQSGRTKVELAYRGGVIHCRTAMNNTPVGGDVQYVFPTGDSNRERVLYVDINGSKQSYSLSDGSLAEGDGLVLNTSTKTITKKNGTWGNISLSANEYLLLYSSKGNLSGELQPYCVFDGTDSLSIKEIDAEQVSSTGSTQGIIVVDGTVYPCSHAPDDHSDYTGKIGSKNHNICHMNAPSYDAKTDMLIVGNGSKSYTLEMGGWIFPNWKNQFSSNSQLDIATMDKIEMTFPAEEFPGEYKAQLCWGYDDYVFLSTCDNRLIYKLQLTKTNGSYDGGYTVIGKWYNATTDIVGGMLYKDGFIFFGVKGSYGIRKCILKTDGTFDSEYIRIKGKQGDMQGLAIENGKVYAYTDYRGYKFDVSIL